MVEGPEFLGFGVWGLVPRVWVVDHSLSTKVRSIVYIDYESIIHCSIINSLEAAEKRCGQMRLWCTLCQEEA